MAMSLDRWMDYNKNKRKSQEKAEDLVMHLPSTSLWLAVLFLLMGGRVSAADDPTLIDARMHAYLSRETERLGERFLNGARTRQEWEAQRGKLDREYMDMLGLWPLPEKTPLK